MDVKLGYAVGTGEEVRIPIAHMVVTGQTQLSGKTTTLEALVHRAPNMRALAFLTKRGEGAFAGARVHQLRPYFRQRADWQFVSAILEAETRERMKFERAWIMRATRAARTLEQVRKNITRLQGKTKRAMDKDIYMQLAAYLDEVLPVLSRIDFADAVVLRPGLNVVDLTAVPVNVQGLVIASMLAWVHERERDVTVILPESWKFIPQGRNSPVKMSTISLAREGAGIKNLLWLDSQDIAGAEKEIIRQASVWLIGVQREANEIKRALGQMGHGIKKPSAADVARLERGQFFACFGAHAVRTYVQPAWMQDSTAVAIARGENPIYVTDRMRQVTEEHGATVLTDDQPVTEDEEDEMNAEQERKLDRLIEAQHELTTTVAAMMYRQFPGEAAKAEMNGTTGNGARPIAPDHFPVGKLDEEALVERIMTRIREQAPKLLHALVGKPELNVTIEREVIQVDGKSLRGRIARLIADDYFTQPKTGYAVWQELARTGTDHGKPNTYSELNDLMKLGFFEKVRVEASKGDGFKVVEGMKVNVIRK